MLSFGEVDDKQSLGFVSDWNRRYNFLCVSIDGRNAVVELIADPHKTAIRIDRYPVWIAAYIDLLELFQIGNRESIDCFTRHAGDVEFAFIGRQSEPMCESLVRRYFGSRWQRWQLDPSNYLTLFEVDHRESVQL